MFLDEIADRLVAQGVGTRGSNIFLGSGASLPDLSKTNGEGPFLTLIQTGGSAPLFVHNEAGSHVQRPTAQITARATNIALALAMSKAAYLALNGVWNTMLNGVFYQKITARQEPTDIGLDDVKRRMIAFNIEVEKQPS